MKNRLGLVLAGGGGKGVYHIGVWKALKEYGVNRNVTDIAGTSVGALNSVLFVQGQYDMAENIWLNISSDKVRTFSYRKMLEIIVSGYLGYDRFLCKCGGHYRRY